ncbi:MAG TPA: glycosyltransferase [Cyclobacteriaceae bacterium]|nr:glycosyltransferase [Cyclobacteriaceae bacterium]
MTFALIVVFVLYGLLVLFLYIGWGKAIARKQNDLYSDYHTMSVIVPVRNEESVVGALVTDLIGQNYQGEFEIIFVDDHSEDSTPMVIQDAIKTFTFCSIVRSPGSGKKSAITAGIQKAKGEIIVTTDGDCRVSENWLQTINLSFINDSVKMLTGAVKIEPDKSVFSKMQSIEFSSLIGSGAATLAFGIPTMCNGANLAFRKNVFEEVEGYKGNEAVASGDDEFLMRKVAARYPKSIMFNNLWGSIVATESSKSLMQFLAQRLRWAGKWKHHHDLSTKLLGLFIFIFHTSVVSLPFLYYLNPPAGDMLLALFISKVILEYLLLNRITSWLGVRWDWLSFILLQFLYPVYAMIIGLGSLFISPVWKGRK